jgi:hypothetical protein
MADNADDQMTDRFLEVYRLWLFGWVLFWESAGDSVSRCMIPWAQRIADALRTMCGSRTGGWSLPCVMSD